MGIATCNYPCGQPDCNGHSSAFDGVAYLPEMPGSRDTCILEAGGSEGVYLAEFDLDMLREYRKAEVHGNAYRRPGKNIICWLKNGFVNRLSVQIIGGKLLLRHIFP